MRPESDMPRPSRRPPRPNRPGRLRLFLIFAVAAFFVILGSLRGIAGFYTDYLWFDALDRTGVWTTVLGARVVLAAIFVTAFFVLAWVNLSLADRFAPEFPPAGPEDEVLSRIYEVIGGRSRLIRTLVAGFFALSVGSGAAAQWRNWLLFRNEQSFGEVEPLFGNDIGFYVFRLPFLSFVVAWLFTALFVILILTAVAHYLNGGIRLQAEERVTPLAKGHLSFLLAALALVRSADYWFNRYELTTSTNGTVDGATFADVTARIPVLNLLVVISLFAAGLLIANIWRRGWVLPAVAVGSWAIASVVMSGIYPLIVQRFSVEPAESTKEAVYIDRNIEATRIAYGLESVVSQPFPYAEELQPADLLANADILKNVPLLDPSVVADTFRFDEAERDLFRFPSVVDVDRYEINGEQVPVVLAARGLDTPGLGDVSWESAHLVFTHGNGLALAQANQTEDSLPVYLIGGIPVDNKIDGDIPLTEPRLYYGENLTTYAIVNSDRQEVDYIAEDGERISYSYEGDGGVVLDSFLRKAGFAMRFGDVDPLISDFIRSDSRVMFDRNAIDRVRKLAPFIEFDSDPYPVVANGRIQYVIDGYTTTNRYPYSQRANLEQLRGGGLARNFNYVRNSVKAVVDGFDGSVTFYVTDPDDPIVGAWRNAFPELFVDLADMDPEIVDNLRYPIDLFTVQTNMWSRYQLNSSDQFYENSGGWSVSQAPGGIEGPESSTTVGLDGTVTRRRELRVNPYYTLIRLPGSNDTEFVALRTFVPVSAEDDRKELTAIMAGVSDVDGDSYGRLVQYTMPGTEAPGPALVAAKIRTQEDISKEMTLLASGGTEVVLDDLLVVPIERDVGPNEEPSASLIYVRPLYVKPTSGTENPELERVIVEYADRVVMCAGFAEALQTLFGVWVEGLHSGDGSEGCLGDTRFDVSGPAGGPLLGSGPSDSAGEAPVLSGAAAADALALLDEADRALGDGNLGLYQRLVDQARALLDDAVAAQETDAGGDDADS